MCGITGFCSNKVDSVAVINDMNNCIIHRGPDAGDYYIDDNRGVVLGHRRLSIIDLSNNGAQPMVSANDRYVLVYNGEIYNCSELRKQLLIDNPMFVLRGTSDTEVLLETIVSEGVEEACKKAVGMFAFALYDKKTGSITLGRDRVGEKPLYYGFVRGDLVWASDISSIRVYPGFDNAVRQDVIPEYLKYSYIAAPKTIYEDIYKLMPGTIKVFEPPYSKGKEIVYYDLKEEYIRGLDNPFKGTIDEAAEELDRLLRKSIKGQMVSDVPLGAFLSGGIDSSTIVALMQDMSEIPIRTFTIGFQEAKYDESSDANTIAKHLGTEHTSLTVTEQDLIDVVPKLPEIFTEPFADSSQIPTYLVSELARSKVTVSLSGDAGDELFGGYNTYWKISSLYRKMIIAPKVLRHLGGNILKNSANDTLYRIGNILIEDDIANVKEAVSYNESGLWPKHIDQSLKLNGKGSIEDEMMLQDLLKYHPNDILVKVDRAGMAVSLENRVPMLDKDVLQLAYSLPINYKIGNVNGDLITKYVLKKVLYKYVPKEIMDRPKKGFSVPLERWLSEGAVHDMSVDILERSTLAKDGLLEQAWIDKVRESFMRTKKNKGLLWNIFILEQWHRRYSQ